MDFKAEANPRIAITLDGKAEITFTTSKSVASSLETLVGKELLVKVSLYSKRRSLSQNAYMWVLLGELSNKLNISKEKIYRSYIKDYGTYEVIPIRKDAIDLFIKSWQSHGLGWVCEVLKESKITGYVNLIAYYGSSTYTREQMKHILEPIIQDCEDQGICTMALSDIMLLKNENDDSE